jgi:hypothetical protein
MPALPGIALATLLIDDEDPPSPLEEIKEAKEEDTAEAAIKMAGLKV